MNEENQETFFDKFVANIDDLRQMAEKKKRYDSSPRKNENIEHASAEDLGLRKY